MVQIIHLLVVLIRHYRAPIRLPQNVTVSLVVVQVELDVYIFYEQVLNQSGILI